jgi:predicted small secreted protein
MKKTFIWILVLLLWVFALSGCRTVQGFGEDITWVGQETEDMLEGK